MAWSDADTYTSGQILTAVSLNKISEDVNIIGAAWTSFTPTLSGTWANGNATTVGKYIKFGRIVLFYAQIVIGSTTTKGAGGMTVSLPVTASSSYPLTGNQASSFNVTLLDSGTKAYPGAVEVPTTSTLSIYSLDASSTYASYGSCTATAPFTWGTGDSVAYSGFYEAATA